VWLWLALLLPMGRPGLPAAEHTYAQSDPEEPASFFVEPTDLSASVEFGEQQSLSLTITNERDSPITPRLYEAREAPPPQISIERAPPPTLQRVALPRQGERVDPRILAELNAASGGTTDFIVFLDDQPDLSAAYAVDDWSERGWLVYRTLYEHARRSQSNLRSWLELRGLPHEPLWIVNAVVVSGTTADVQALAARADVAMLRANRTLSLPVPRTDSDEHDMPAAVPLSATTTLSGSLEWNIDQIDAERVWQEFGVAGDGITVGTIDSGAFYEHPALIEQYRGYRAGGPFAHAYNWYDPSRASDVPQDNIDHGTHVLGTIVGRGGGSEERPFIGVAPGASWIAARGCRNASCNDSDLISAAQWVLAPTDPDGENPRPELRPHIVNNSWASDSSNDFYISYTTAWRAAGIFPVFAAGNQGHLSCGTAASPGNYADVFAVGATRSNDEIASFSSVGPSDDGTLKPDMMAPGVAIRSAIADDQMLYGQLQGTSMAAPHVAGTVALLWSANPLLIGDYEATYDILTDTAVPRTDDDFAIEKYENCRADTVPNNIYGYGRLNTYAAVAAATVDVPWLDVPDALPTLQPGASVNVSLTVDSDYVPGPGVYRARALVGTGDLSQSPLRVPITLTVNDTANKATVTGTVSDSASDMPLSGRLFVDDRLSVDVDMSGAYSVTLPVRSEPYDFRTSIIGYASQTRPVTLTSGVTQTLDFMLTADIPRLHVFPLTDTISLQGSGPQPISVPAEISSAPLELLTTTLSFDERIEYPYVVYNAGEQPLHYTAHVAADRFGIWRSDDPADDIETRWYARPLDATQLVLEDDGTSEKLELGFSFPFYGQSYQNVYVGANGLITFQPFSSKYFVSGCLPLPETIGPAVVPFRFDLDPSQGGEVWAAQMSDGFVISFENVPQHTEPLDPDAPTFSFQVMLSVDGRVIFNYGTLTDIPDSLAVGIQGNSQTVQSIGCGDETPIGDDLTLELRLQSQPTRWLSTELSPTATLPPGWGAVVGINFSWVQALYPQPYRTTVRFESNDPWYPVVQLPVQVRNEPAPNTVFLPMLVQSPGQSDAVAPPEPWRVSRASVAPPSGATPAPQTAAERPAANGRVMSLLCPFLCRTASQ
jgi:subtilisin family serine protease